MSKAVISTIGHDRPGLVSSITSLAQRLGLNIEDSRMTVLGGEFAVLMALAGESAALREFDSAMTELCRDDNLAYIYRQTEARGTTDAVQEYTASIAALDHPGIVAALAGFFSDRNINIRDLRTDTSPAPHTGTPIFNIDLLAEIPAGIEISKLKDDFEAFCNDENLDGTLTPGA